MMTFPIYGKIIQTFQTTNQPTCCGDFFGERDLKTPTWPTLAMATLAGATGRTAGRSSGLFRAGDAAGSLWAATAMAADAFSTARTIIYVHVLVLEPHGAANMWNGRFFPTGEPSSWTSQKWCRLGGQNTFIPRAQLRGFRRYRKCMKMPAIGMFNPCFRLYHFDQPSAHHIWWFNLRVWWLNPFLFDMFELAQHPLNYQKKTGEWRPSPWFTNWASPLLTAQPVISIQIHFVKGVGQRGPLHLGRLAPEMPGKLWENHRR